MVVPHEDRALREHVVQLLLVPERRLREHLREQEFAKFCKFLAGSLSAVSKRNFATRHPQINKDLDVRSDDQIYMEKSRDQFQEGIIGQGMLLIGKLLLYTILRHLT